MEHARDFPLEVLMGLREEAAETRADVRHLSADLADFKAEIRGDIRRLDDRIFQMLLLQLGTLVTALASLATALVTAFAS